MASPVFEFAVSERFLEFLCDKAKELQETAAQSGSHHDGGAESLDAQIDAYLCGQHNEMPERWKRYVNEFNAKADPEWQLYLRLKDKFRNYDRF